MAIDSLRIINEIRKNGKAHCPLCGNGDFVARNDVPIEKQTQFQCANCKEKIILRIKF